MLNNFSHTRLVAIQFEPFEVWKPQGGGKRGFLLCFLLEMLFHYYLFFAREKQD
jgi:hypothetical protein